MKLSLAFAVAVLGLLGLPADGPQFADWTAFSNGNRTLTGTLLGHPVTITSDGPRAFGGVIDNSSTLLSSADFDPPLDHADLPELYGTNPASSYTMTFGAPVRDPILHLQSMASTLTFPPGTRITRRSGEPGFSVSGNTVTATTDLNGTIQLGGDFTTISFTALWTVSAADGVGFAVGGTAVPVPTPTPSPTVVATVIPTVVPTPVPTPVAGVSVTSRVASGTVTVRLPGGSGFAALTTPSLPVGTVVDARKGAIDFTAATPSGTVASARVSAGIFAVRQARASGSIPTFVVATASGQERACAPGRRPPKKGVVRTLSVVAKGRFRSVPMKGVVTGRDAAWTTVDRCDGTLTTVQRGRVSIKHGRRTVSVRAGHRYLIRARLFAARARG